MPIRWDRATIRKKPVRTPEGFLKVEASATRTGVFNYRNGDGSIRRELRHPKDVLEGSSLDSMKMIPVTNGHPPTILVDSGTARRFSVGSTGENVRPDGTFLVVPIVITDQDAIADIEAGRRFVSMGYQADLLPERGKYDGEEYDARQTKIRYNHLALVDAARAGPDATVHMDAADAVQVYPDDNGTRNDKAIPFKAYTLDPESATWDAATEVRDADAAALRQMATWYDAAKPDDKTSYKLPHHRASNRNTVWRAVSAAMGALLGARGGVDIPQADRRRVYDHLARHYAEFGKEPPDLRTDSEPKPNPQGGNMPTMRIDNIDYEAAQEVINHASKETARADAAEKALAESKATLETVTGERDAHKAKLDEAEKVDTKSEIRKAVTARVDLERRVAPLFKGDKEAKLDELDDKALKVAAILKVTPDAKLDEKSDEYIDARFDAAMESAKEAKSDKADENFGMQRVQAKAENNDEDNSPAAARQRMIERMKSDHLDDDDKGGE
jgi:hypothetical protein